MPHSLLWEVQAAGPHLLWIQTPVILIVNCFKYSKSFGEKSYYNLYYTLIRRSGEWNNSDYLFVEAPVSGWDVLSEHFVLRLDVLEGEQMAKYADLCESGQIVMTRQLGQSISKSAGLVGYSHSALVSIYQKWHSGEPATGSWWSKGWPLWSNPTDELGFRLHSTSEFVVYGVV